MADYNGWTNYETWAVNLWLTNEEPTYRHCRELASTSRAAAKSCEQVQRGTWDVAEARKYLLADALKELVETCNPVANSASMYADLLAAAICVVNWQEIAQAFLDEE